MKKINYNQLVNELQETIETKKVRTELINFMSKILENYDGVKITKRIANEINKQLENNNMSFVCIYNKNYGMYHLEIYKIKESGYADYNQYVISSLIGHFSSETFDYNRWIESNAGYFLENERQKDLENKIKQLPELVLRWNTLVEDLEKVSEDLEKVSQEAGDNYPLYKYFRIG